MTQSGGVFSGGGFDSGINFTTSAPINVRVSNISVAGVKTYGINLGLGDSSFIDSSTVRTAGSYALSATFVQNCGASDCFIGIISQEARSSHVVAIGDYGIYAVRLASDCYGESTAAGPGLYTNCATGCFGKSADGVGLQANAAVGCFGQSASYYGLTAGTATSCYGSSNTNTGLRTSAGSNCYGFSNGNFDATNGSNLHNCYGYNGGSGYGLSGNEVTNCRGASSGTHAIFINEIGAMCYGYASSGSPSTTAFILGNGQAGPLNLP